MSVMTATDLSSWKRRRRSSWRHRLVGAVIAADVDPVRPVGRPYPAPAAVIVAVVGEGDANERKPMEAVEAVDEEAVVEEAVVEEAVIECTVRKPR